MMATGDIAATGTAREIAATTGVIAETGAEGITRTAANGATIRMMAGGTAATGNAAQTAATSRPTRPEPLNQRLPRRAGTRPRTARARESSFSADR